MAKKSRKKKKGSPASSKPDLNPKDFEATSLAQLREAVQKTDMDTDLRKKILDLIGFVLLLRQAYDKKYLALTRVLKMIFGLKSERRSSRNSKKPSNGRSRGKSSADSFEGAEIVKCSHPELSSGDPCPQCHQGHLVEDEPSKKTLFDGQSPITVTVFHLQRLVCSLCSAVFTAPLPDNVENDPDIERLDTPDPPTSEGEKNQEPSLDDPSDHQERTRARSPERIWKTGFYANIVIFTYLYAMPVYRFSLLLRSMGIPLAESTIQGKLDRVFDVFLAIYMAMIREAAKRELFYIDDTGRKVLEAKQMAKEPHQIIDSIEQVSLDEPAKHLVMGRTGKPRSTTRTSCIVASQQGQSDLILYRTDYLLAGECMDKVLAHRPSSLKLPKIQSDSLSHNQTTHVVMEFYCMDHLRRFYINIEDKFPEIAKTVLDVLAQVYRFDRHTENKKLNPSQRLAYHQAHSAPILKTLKQTLQVAQSAIEPSSSLGSVLKHHLHLWDKYTGFLHYEGIPLSNARCERVLKRVIAQRKVSMFFKTLRGAWRGDVFQSVLITAFEDKSVNHWHYVRHIIAHRDEVIKAPERWLPHNYTDNFAR